MWSSEHSAVDVGGEGLCVTREGLCQLVCSNGVEVGCGMNVGYISVCAVTLPDTFGIGLCAELKS